MSLLIDVANQPQPVYGMPMENYHSLKSCMSNSGIKQFMRSPAHYKAWLDTPDAASSPALTLGRMAHTFVLEPNTIRQRYEQVPSSINKRTKAYQEIKQQAQDDGKELIDETEWVEMCRLRKSVMDNPYAKAVLSKGKAEASFFWQDAEHQTHGKARADWYDGDLIADLKTAKDASPAVFERDAFKLGYHIQAAWYVDGVEAVTGTKPSFYFVVVEKEPPYAVAVYKASSELIQFGRTAYKQVLQKYKECLITGVWPAYEEKVHVLGLPSWAC